MDRPNLRQDVGKRMAELGWACRCIRCREVGGGPAGPMELVERRYASSGGAEVFLSWETPDRATLFAFLRLRLPGPGCRTPFVELAGAASGRCTCTANSSTSTSTPTLAPAPLAAAVVDAALDV